MGEQQGSCECHTCMAVIVAPSEDSSAMQRFNRKVLELVMNKCEGDSESLPPLHSLCKINSDSIL
jgi:hypothetical protein